MGKLNGRKLEAAKAASKPKPAASPAAKKPKVAKGAD